MYGGGGFGFDAGGFDAGGGMDTAFGGGGGGGAFGGGGGGGGFGGGFGGGGGGGFGGGGGGGFGGGGGGGGFDDGAGGGGSQGGGKGGKRSDNQSLLPCTIHQIHSATQLAGEETPRINGREAQQVTIVGVINDVDRKSNVISYRLDDGTGFIDVKVWPDGDDTQAVNDKRDQMKEGVYVRAIGALRVFNSVKSITAFNMRPVTDFNELSFHVLETIHVHVAMTKGPGAMGAAPAPALASGRPGAAAMQPASGAAGGGGDASALQQEIVSLMINNGHLESGLSIHQVVEQFGARYGGEHAVREAVSRLVDEGHLYSTVDEDHYKHTG